MNVLSSFGEGQIIVPPQNDAPAFPATGIAFILCPLPLPFAAWGHPGALEIYRLAYEQARAALRPSWYEQLLRASRN
jgi:hypothetical protein